MLKTIIKNGYYNFQPGFESWEDAVRESYRPMLNDGTVDDGYVERVIKCVHEYGPYIVLVPGVAMPHSTQGAEGCHGTAISFMRTEKPVDFDPADEDKKARLFFSLASQDADAHLANIQKLMDTLMNEEVVDALYKTTCVEDLIAVVDKYYGEGGLS